MIYLSGAPSQAQAHLSQSVGLGLMCTPLMGTRPALIAHYARWAADTGCYSQGASFQLDKYLAWLTKLQPLRASCLFATAPDMVADARATWERSAPVLPLIRALGYKAALVAQDGLEDLSIEWGAFDALFTGGTTEWKLSEVAYEIGREAKARGKWLHMGRVNSRRRLIAAAVSGYDSADGTAAAFGPDKYLRQFRAWLTELETQRRFIA